MFRYPGSKGKLLPIIMEYLNPLIQKHNSFIDVFVGGGSVLLEVAQKYPKIKLYANDKDYWMYCFWSIVAGNDSNKLNSLLNMVGCQPTLELFYKLREIKTKDDVECAYRAIFFNRCCFSGILSSGPIGGKNQKSKYTVDCRYNSNKLKEKILQCHSLLKDRTQVDNKDVIHYEQLNLTNEPAYLDPPYIEAGKSLYFEYMSKDEHKYLGYILSDRKNWVLSYDDCAEIRYIYSKKSIIDLPARYCINGKKNNWESKNELIIIP